MLLFTFRNAQQLLLSFFFSAALLTACSPSKKIAGNKQKGSQRTVEVVGEDFGNWDDGTRAPVEAPPKRVEVSKKETESKADKVISTARTFIGTPYKYGGTTRSGMDCSALLLNSFGAVKLNLPRSSAAQSQVGTEIDMDELKPGDLVFFATGNKKKEITHVGLVTDVKSKDNVKFIHASSSLGVVETNLFTEYYQKRFRLARRVIK
jgi:cell wall-associated NlpC family hydrolase